MKNIAFILGLGLLLGFTSCEEKELATLNTESQTGNIAFNLLEESIENGNCYELLQVDDAKTVVVLEYDSPDFGVSLEKKYYAEVSFYSSFPEDKTETLKTMSRTQSFELNTMEFNKAINALHEPDIHGALVSEHNIYVRMRCIVSNATSYPTNDDLLVKPAISNGVKMIVKPYPLSVPPATFFIIGLASWDNSTEAIGSGIIPLSVLPEYEYNTLDGTGEFVYTGYFEAKQGFKLISTPGDWDDQWGMDATGNFVYQDGGSQNIEVSSSGYYQITLNTQTNKLSIEPTTAEPCTYNFIDFVGDFNGWGGAPIVNLEEVNNTAKSSWYTDVTIEEDGGAKFRANGEWGTDWGGDSFPYATAPSGGNIPVEKGSYRVVFNVHDKCYMFFKK